jgi:hypothetical protein
LRDLPSISALTKSVLLDSLSGEKEG